EIRAVRQIEHLKERRDCVAFLDLEVLADSRVELKERLSAQTVKGKDCALARPQTIAVQDSDRIRGARIPECGQSGLHIVRTAGENDHAICAATAFAKYIHRSAI